MAENSEKSGLEEVFKAKEEALKAKEAQEKKEQPEEPEAKEAKPAEEIIDEQEVTAQIDKAKKGITDTFLSDESKNVMLKALDELVAKQKTEVERAKIGTKDDLIKLFRETKGKLDEYKKQPEVQKVYDPLWKLFDKKEPYLTVINLKKYGVTDAKKGYWTVIRDELASKGITENNIREVQTILGLEPDGKIGPKTIEATWKMLTGKPKDVKNVIREKGEEGKTERENQAIVDAIMKEDEAEEVAAKKVAAEAAATQVAVPGKAQPTDSATAGNDQKSETEDAFLDGLYSDDVSQSVPLPDNATATPGAAAPAEPVAEPPAETLDAKLSVYDEQGNVRTSFKEEELKKMTRPHKEKIPDNLRIIMSLPFTEATFRASFDYNAREKVEVDLTELGISEFTIKNHLESRLPSMHIDSRKITLPKPQRGDVIGKPGIGGHTYYVYDGVWEKDRRKGEEEVTITESLPFFKS